VLTQSVCISTLISHVSGAMVSVVVLSAVDRGLEPRLMTIKFGICCFSAKHAALMRKNSDRLALNQDNVSTRGLLCQ
jgi:hypothetical protein